ncbi:MAG: G8 domain-containing protein [Gemmataceae bacterium]|nr:G8 domain-containing protein [Gemmataceae bacterium]
MLRSRRLLAVVAALAAALSRPGLTPAAEGPPVVRTAKSGPWSDGATWEGGKTPGAGVKVLIRTGHAVVYDVRSEVVIRSLHISGSLSFARDRDTRLDVGLIKIQAGEDTAEEGFECDAHVAAPDPKAPRPAFEVGTADAPIPHPHTALIRLHYVAGMDKDSCPAVVCCGGRMDFHGQPLQHTWVRLAKGTVDSANAFALSEPVPGWRPGDRVILTTTDVPMLFGRKSGKIEYPTVRLTTHTEELTVKSVRGDRVVTHEFTDYPHAVDGDWRPAVANLSRNVVVESADPNGHRGHTMYHRHSAGAVSYAEFRHLGKPGVLGRYSLHYHQCGDTMRGSSVVGASIHDSGNRWLTVHGTDYLVVRDCVGYNAVGHGFFCEDGTEVYNVFDHNLAVQACRGVPLPKQLLPFDRNDGAGFWWANSLNTFTRNLAVECDQYGFRFEVLKDKDFDPVLKVRQPDGTRKAVDVRTLPFVRFDDNEVHCQRRFGLNLGGIRGVATQEDLDSFRTGDDGYLARSGDVGGVGPDHKHPFVIRNFRAWRSAWSFHSGSPCVLIDGLDAYEGMYGIWRTRMDRHEYENLSLRKLSAKAVYNPFGGNPKVGDSYLQGLDPVDDLPPVTVITSVRRRDDGKLLVRGTTSDNGEVTRVLVNGIPATSTRDGFAEWEAVVEDTAANRVVTAHAEDDAGNVEKTPHTLTYAPTRR